MRTRHGDDAARTVEIAEEKRVVQEAVATETWLGGRREDLFLKSNEEIQLGRHFGRGVESSRWIQRVSGGKSGVE